MVVGLQQGTNCSRHLIFPLLLLQGCLMIQEKCVTVWTFNDRTIGKLREFFLFFLNVLGPMLNNLMLTNQKRVTIISFEKYKYS